MSSSTDAAPYTSPFRRPAGGQRQKLSIFGTAMPNGLGHLRRLTAILAEVHRQDRIGVEFTVQCDAKHVGRLAPTASVQALRDTGTSWLHPALTTGIAWPPAITEADLASNSRRLPFEAMSADLVVSDNLALPLHERPDTVLTGSFLWSDVLEPLAGDDPLVDEFVVSERNLLQAYRPPMVCVADLAMPGVLERTAAVPVGWMCETITQPATEHGRIAVLGGRTGARDTDLVTALRAITADGHPVSAQDSLRGLLEVSERDEVKPFTFTEDDWADCSLVVCRPGTGTLTECVARGLPVLALDDAHNIELHHNACRVESLGTGWRLPDPLDIEAIGSTLDLVADEDARRAVTDRILALDRSGLEQAATWLLERLDAST